MFFLPLTQSGNNSLHHLLHRDSPGSMGLRIKKGLHMPDAVPYRLLQIGHSQKMKILPIPQHRRPLVIQIQEGLQIPEVIRPAQGWGVGKPELHPVLAGQMKSHLGLKGALQVQMQFRLGQGRGQSFQGLHNFAKDAPARVNVSGVSPGPAAPNPIRPG